jgi:hypothetical protein
MGFGQKLKTLLIIENWMIYLKKELISYRRFDYFLLSFSIILSCFSLFYRSYKKLN